MICVICKGEDIVTREVEEEISVGENIFRTKIEAQVCASCGERYYSRSVVRQLEKIREDLRSGKLDLREVGKVLEEA